MHTKENAEISLKILKMCLELKPFETERFIWRYFPQVNRS
jgi:hypothetical protein